MASRLEIERKMNEALHYVSTNLLSSGHNSKPVLFHSFKVGYKLYINGYRENIVIAGILHDLIEDTNITYNQLKEEFGKEIADLVQVVSFDASIKDKQIQTEELFNRVKSFGFDALIIKCADLLDNIDYIEFVSNLDKRKELLDKHKMFLEISKDQLCNELIYQELQNKVNIFQ